MSNIKEISNEILTAAIPELEDRLNDCFNLIESQHGAIDDKIKHLILNTTVISYQASLETSVQLFAVLNSKD